MSRLGFYYGDPTLFYIFQVWDTGIDNPRITYESPTPVENRTWGAIKDMFR